ncbi:MAG: GLUG motif-containing protein [Rhizomicrobium sp.]
MVARLSSLFLLSVVALTSAAQADLSISNQPMQNMDCQAGVCTATSKKAVLNVGDLQTMLAGGDVTVKTGAVAKDIAVDQPLSWSSTNRLTLDAQRSVTVKKPVTVAGQGAVTIMTNDGASDGDLYFFGKGQITFWNLSSSLVINSESYTLAGDLPTLAADMNAVDGGSFALTNDYDSQVTYKHSPIEYFQGNFEGLGHTIRHFKLRGGSYHTAGLIGETGGGTIRDIYLKQVDVQNGNKLYVGGLIGNNGYGAAIINTSVDGKVTAKYHDGAVGGLVGYNAGGLVLRSRSAATVIGNSAFIGNSAGGLVGQNAGIVDQSYATGAVSGKVAGGVVGTNPMTGTSLTNSYATGPVTSGQGGGGFIGVAGSAPGLIATSRCYSTGCVQSEGIAGGFAGDDSSLTVSQSYWDLDTSGISDAGQGAGTPHDDPGISGLTDGQLRSALPQGFDPAIWRQSQKINNGYPYLRANPPR